MSSMDRMPCEYRAGYHHGYTQSSPMNYDGFNPVAEADRGYGSNPFANHDYRNGYKAGANDAWWRAFRGANGYHCENPEFMPGAWNGSRAALARVGGAE